MLASRLESGREFGAGTDDRVSSLASVEGPITDTLAPPEKRK